MCSFLRFFARWQQAWADFLLVALPALTSDAAAECDSAAYSAEDCTKDAPTCYITIGGVFREDCLPFFAEPVANYIRAVNAMNNGSGFGVNAGSSAPRYFYQLRWLNATYPRGQLDLGLAEARVLFPQLDFVQGLGARCAGSDPDLIQMANVAKRLKRIYMTGRCVRPYRTFRRARSGSLCIAIPRLLPPTRCTCRGPSMLFQPPGYGVINITSVNEYLFSLHLNADLYSRLSLQQLALMYAAPAAPPKPPHDDGDSAACCAPHDD